MSQAFSILLAIVSLIIAHQYGWDNAHSEVARECKVLNRFYVAHEVFDCTLSEKGVYLGIGD